MAVDRIKEANANGYLKDTDRYVLRHLEEKLAGRTPTLTDVQFTELINYRYGIRDAVIKNQSPDAVAIPAWLPDFREEYYK